MSEAFILKNSLQLSNSSHILCKLFDFRAQRRIQGEDVFGNKIKVLNPSSSNDATLKNYTGLLTSVDLYIFRV